MSTFTRRRTLQTGGVVLLGMLAGCVGDDATDDRDDDVGDGEDADDRDDDTTDDGGDTTDEPTVIETEHLPLGAQGSRPWWHEYDEDAPGGVYLHESEESLRDAPIANLSDEQQEELSAFVDETDFETSVLLQVGSVGPNTCYDHVEVSDIALEDGRLVGSARAQVTDEDAEACGDAITYAWTLVRVVVDGPKPDSARLSVTDGWENEREVEAPKERPLDSDELDGYVRPDGDPPATPPELDCEGDDFERHGQWADEDDISLGDAYEDGDAVFALRVAEQRYERGDTVQITLTNLTDRERMTGNDSKFNLQVETEAGWQDVRGFDDGEPVGYTDEGVLHPPGDGFEWEIELTEDGVASEGMQADRLRVCPDLPAGRYRFLFWEVDVAVEFDVE